VAGLLIKGNHFCWDLIRNHAKSHSEMNHQLQAIVTILALINPVVCATIFTQLEAGQNRPTQLKAASQAAGVVLVVLAVSALVGTKLLHAFGISLDAFSVAGGGVLAWIGFSMISRKDSGGTSSNKSVSSQPSISPLVLFAASPGTITGVITLAAAHSQLAIPVTALIAVAVGVLVMWLVILATIHLGDRKKSNANKGIAQDITSRLMGLIVLAMGVQFALTGLRAFFTATTGS
jgi:multiple antibiotic resistance protein